MTTLTRLSSERVLLRCSHRGVWTPAHNVIIYEVLHDFIIADSEPHSAVRGCLTVLYMRRALNGKCCSLPRLQAIEDLRRIRGTSGAPRL